MSTPHKNNRPPPRGAGRTRPRLDLNHSTSIGGTHIKKRSRHSRRSIKKPARCCKCSSSCCSLQARARWRCAAVLPLRRRDCPLRRERWTLTRGPFDVRQAPDARRRGAGRPGRRHFVNAGSACSHALENLCASSRDHLTIGPSGFRGPCYRSGPWADGSSGPHHGPPAIRRPRIRRREYGAPLSRSNATGQIVANRRTCARRATDEYPAEIPGSGVDAQDLHDGAPLTLPKCGSPILRRRRGGGCDNKGQSDRESVHVRLQSGGICA
jgi:hypothetical protein